MTENRSKTVVIIALCLTLIFMGVGFAALSQTLTINTEGTISTSTDWQVQFENFTVTPTAEGNSITTSGTELTANFKLAKPGDSVTFSGIIANNGTIDAVLTAITEGKTFENNYVERTVTFPSEGSTLAAQTKTTEVEITYTFKEGIEQLPSADAATITDKIVFDYDQK